MPRIMQEFHCHGCDGYVIFGLQSQFNRRVMVVCPNCGRKHQRVVENGVIRDRSKIEDESNIEEINVPKSAWSNTARSHVQEKASKKRKGISGLMMGGWYAFRDGAVIETPRSLLEESWFDRYGDKA